MITIGIDNGLTGAVVAIDDELKVVSWFDTPVLKVGKKTQFALAEMAGKLAAICNGKPGGLLSPGVRVFLEKAQSMPRRGGGDKCPACKQPKHQGGTSTFNTGFGAGLWQGICAGLGVPFEVVHPRTWQKVLKDLPSGDTKARSILKCQQVFPELPVLGPRGGKKDGRADAACIAFYGLAFRGES